MAMVHLQRPSLQVPMNVVAGVVVTGVVSICSFVAGFTLRPWLVNQLFPGSNLQPLETDLPQCQVNDPNAATIVIPVTKAIDRGSMQSRFTRGQMNLDFRYCQYNGKLSAQVGYFNSVDGAQRALDQIQERVDGVDSTSFILLGAPRP